jgi:hypothetical protein
MPGGRLSQWLLRRPASWMLEPFTALVNTQHVMAARP